MRARAILGSQMPKSESSFCRPHEMAQIEIMMKQREGSGRVGDSEAPRDERCHSASLGEDRAEIGSDGCEWEQELVDRCVCVD
jgi:hypothetical protein